MGFDSLGVLSVVTMLENRYGLALENRQMESVRTFAELMDLIKARSMELG